MITYHAKDVAEWLQRRRARQSCERARTARPIPLDELDKRLLNLMQGTFPLEPRPYAARGASRPR